MVHCPDSAAAEAPGPSTWTRSSTGRSVLVTPMSPETELADKALSRHSTKL